MRLRCAASSADSPGSRAPRSQLAIRQSASSTPRRLPWRARRALARWLLVVDPEIGWLPFAARRGRRLLRGGGYDALLSTSGPYTDHLVGLRLKRATGLPWVADFRDPWLGNESASFPTALHRALVARLERRVVEAADRVLVVSEPMRTMLLARYAGLAPGNVVALPNGFDPADFVGVEPAARDGRLTLVYAGSLYGSRTARPFLAALRRVVDGGGVPRGQIRVRLAGNTGQEAAQVVAEWGLGDVVELSGYLSHRQVLAEQLAADALLLIVGAGPGSEVVLTAKIFEYLAVGAPILGLVPPGAAADLLREARVGRLAPPDDEAAIAAALSALFADWQSGRLAATPDPAVVARYNRREQARRLAAILDELAVSSSPLPQRGCCIVPTAGREG
jgi:glycosyltransferase involved in cell wall biosynthesis